MKATELTTVDLADALKADEIASLLERSSLASGHAALSEHKRMAVLGEAHGGDGSSRATVVGAVEARSDKSSSLLGFAPVVGGTSPHQYAVEVVVDPAAQDPSELADSLVDGAVALVVRLGGGTLRLWSPQATPADDRRALAFGFHRDRDLIQMRCRLPLEARVRSRRAPPPTRPFRPGHDEHTWVEVNNRAFGSHPEQGHWSVADLEERMREPWFDPDGLLLVEEHGRLAGFCWTKVHKATEPPMGEIYVIGIDPDFQGRGWGRSLTEAGLDWMGRHGLTVGMLYVDADNTAAVSLYRSMGFIDHHVDRAYAGTFS